MNEETQERRELSDTPCSGMMYFQTAPYKELCGCVSAPLTSAEDRRWDNLTEEGRIRATESLLRRKEGDRMYDGECTICNATGILPQYYNT